MQSKIKITDLCRELKITSRTLRHWEEKGLIKSIHDNPNAPRYYNGAEKERIKKIIFLQKMGFKLNDIKLILSDGNNLRDSIKIYRAQISSQINTLQKQLRMLQITLACIDSGKDIYETDVFQQQQKNAEHAKVAERLAHQLLDGDFDGVYECFSQTMKVRCLPSQIKAVWEEHTVCMGNFLHIEKTESQSRDTATSYLMFEKCGVTVQCIFADTLLTGLWFDYYQKEQK